MWSHFWRHGFEFCTSLIFIFVIYCLFQNLWTKLTFYSNGIVHASGDNKKGIIYIYILHNRKVWKKSYLQKLFIHHLQLTIMKKKVTQNALEGGCQTKTTRKWLIKFVLRHCCCLPFYSEITDFFTEKEGKKSLLPPLFRLFLI